MGWSHLGHGKGLSCSPIPCTLTPDMRCATRSAHLSSWRGRDSSRRSQYAPAGCAEMHPYPLHPNRRREARDRARSPELLAQARQQPALEVRHGMVRRDAREAGAADAEVVGAVQADAAAGRRGARGPGPHSRPARPREVGGGAAEERDAQRPHRAPAGHRWLVSDTRRAAASPNDASHQTAKSWPLISIEAAK